VDEHCNPPRVPWQPLVAEMIGTGLLMLLGLSVVIVMFGDGSTIAALVPSVTVRQVVSGFVFGTVGALITVSPVGKESGAHLNPAVTFGFWMMRKMEAPLALGYVAAQLAGAIVGALPLLAWGEMGRSVAYGATVPGHGYTLRAVLLGEAATTFTLIVGLCAFLGARALRPFTPALIPFLYAIMVPLESSISGTSTNPARSLGPAVVSGVWDGWWVYWAGPLLGTLAALVIVEAFIDRIEVAKLYYFQTDRRRLFHRRRAATEGALR